MALSVCLVFALVWSVERMVPGWISYFEAEKKKAMKLLTDGEKLVLDTITGR